MDREKYDAGLEDKDLELICKKCNKKLELKPVLLEYLGNGFPIDLGVCPKCNMVYVPENLALGKMLHVEKSLEDK